MTGVAVGWAVGTAGKVIGVDVGCGVSVGRAAKAVAKLPWVRRRISSSDRAQPANAKRATRVNAMPKRNFTVIPWNWIAGRKRDGRSRDEQKALNSSVGPRLTACQKWVSKTAGVLSGSPFTW